MERFRIGRSTLAALAATAVVAVGGGVAYAANQGGDGGSTQQQGAQGFVPGEAPEGAPPQGQMPPGGPGEGCGPHGGPGGPPFEDAASYIGISVEDLQAELQDGKTPGEVAEAEGKSADGLRDALVDAATEKLDGAVEDGELDAEQRDEILDGITERVDAFVDGERPPMPQGPPGGAPMPGAPQSDQQGGNQGSSVPQVPGGAAPVTLENL